MPAEQSPMPFKDAACSVDAETKLINNAPLATEDKQDANIAALAALATAANQVSPLAAGVPVGTKTSSAAAWDNGGVLDLGASHSHKIVRIDAIEDTYIVADNAAGNPAAPGGFVPAGSSKVYPVVGVRYIHFKAVAVAGVIGVDAFAPAS